MIKEDLVLTAYENCANKQPVANMKVIAGVAEKTHLVSNYQNNNDIAVMKLTNSTTNCQKLKLPNSDISMGDKITVPGWSITTNNRNIGMRTTEVFKLTAEVTEKCFKEFVTPKPTDMATCCGDLGSPAYVGNTIYGISLGNAAATVNGKEHYINVYDFMSDISEFCGENPDYCIENEE